MITAKSRFKIFMLMGVLEGHGGLGRNSRTPLFAAEFDSGKLSSACSLLADVDFL